MRKAKMLKSPEGKYAFVGIGQHSMSNLYPIIHYLGIDLKYLVVQSEKTLSMLQNSQYAKIATNDLDAVISDNDIKGIFISATPKAHYGLLKKVISGNKKVFVEKPPCYGEKELKELQNLEQQYKNAGVFVGLQKRYAPAIEKLAAKIKKEKVDYYNIKYRTGKYPEGNKTYDLFIHYIDLAIYLFGKVKSFEHVISNEGVVFIIFNHENGTKGFLELSCNHSWKNIDEGLYMATSKGFYTLSGLSSLSFTAKPSSIMGIPMEKVFETKTTIQYLYNQKQELPTPEENNISTNGYFGEINNFIAWCNSGDSKYNKSSLDSISHLYYILDKINEIIK